MSLYRIQEIAKNTKLGIWHITESLDELLKMKQFSEADLQALNSFSYEHRKKEWLVARILLGKLSNERDVRIIYDGYNKPFLENSKKHISISHSHDLLAVILDERETGIDIELLKTKIVRIKEKFMSAAELKSLQRENFHEQLTVCWCAKESLYKLYGKKELVFKENLIIEPFQYSGKGIVRGRIKKNTVNKFFSIQYEKMNSGDSSYMLAYVINED